MVGVAIIACIKPGKCLHMVCHNFIEWWLELCGTFAVNIWLIGMHQEGKQTKKHLHPLLPQLGGEDSSSPISTMKRLTGPVEETAQKRLGPGSAAGFAVVASLF